MKRTRRRPGLAALSLATAVPLVAGCGVFSPTTTNLDYNPSDGVTAQIGDVLARNLLVVGNQGAEGLVSGALVNNGSSDAAVTIAAGGQQQAVTVTVPPGQVVQLGSGSDQTPVVVAALTQPAGGLIGLTLSSPAGGSVASSVPVVAPQLEYSTVTPTAS